MDNHRKNCEFDLQGNAKIVQNELLEKQRYDNNINKKMKELFCQI
jgi:hypothetical protein